MEHKNREYIAYLPEFANISALDDAGRPPSYNSVQKIIKPKIQNHICNSIYTVFEDYCENSSLHGLKYIGDVTLTFFERFYWLVSFLISVAFSAYFIASLYLRYDESPIIISFSPTAVTIDTVPFPAITICNINVIKRQWKSEISAMYPNGSDVVNKVCKLLPAEDGDHIDMLHALYMGHHSCQEMLYKFSWQNSDETNVLDTSRFIPEIIDNVMCCTFNSPPYLRLDKRAANVTQWNPEDGYQKDSSMDLIPMRVIGAGVAYSLRIEIDTEIIQYYCPSTIFSVGFKIILSNPLETPKLTDGFLITPGRETMVGIEPTIKDSERRVEGVDLRKRGCYFIKERYLRFYRTYTEANCKIECAANYTMKHCNCMPLFLHYQMNEGVKLMQRVESSLFPNYNVCLDLNKCAKAAKLAATSETCNCLPACYEITYAPHSVDAAEFSRLVLSIIQKNFNGKHLQENIAIVRLFFANDKIIKETKSVIYGFSEFLSNTGGLLGLFIGFSFLSVVEILYYLSLRFYVIIKQNKKKEEFKQQAKIVKAHIDMPAICN